MPEAEKRGKGMYEDGSNDPGVYCSAIPPIDVVDYCNVLGYRNGVKRKLASKFQDGMFLSEF
jgi:hypothetical protein